MLKTKSLCKIANIDDLFQPFGIEDFEANYWEQKVLHIQRDDPAFFLSLFSVEALDKLLEYNRPRGSSLRVVKNQQPLSSSTYENQDGSLNLNQLYAAYADGHTIVINEIQRYYDPIKILVENIRQYMNHHVVANLYLTPENEKALSPHYDSHDVFALQISGEKHWLLYDDTYCKTPLVHSFQPVFQREHLTGARQVTLKAGDIMYIPRGVPHEAFTTDKSSMHITIGVHSTQWIDLIAKSLINLSQKNINLRQALPLGFLNDPNRDLLSADAELDFLNVIKQVFTKENINSSLSILAEELRTKEQPAPDGHFASLDKINRVSLDSFLMKREGMVSKVSCNITGARISFQGNVIKGPQQIESSLEFISQQTGVFLIKDIPCLNDDNKLKLAKRLIRGGLLKVM